MLGVGISDIAVPVAVARIVYSHGTALQGQVAAGDDIAVAVGGD